MSSKAKRALPAGRPTTRANSESKASKVDPLVSAHSQIATPGLDFAAVIAMICERAQALTGASGASFARLDDEYVTLIHAVGIGAGVAGTKLPATNSVMALAILENQVQLVDDADCDLRPNVDAKRLHHTRSMLVVPLRIDEAHRYALLIAALQPNAFTPQHALDLEVLAGAMTAALINGARVEAETELRAQAVRLELVVQTQSELSTMAGSVDAAMSLVCRRARSITGAVGASVAKIEGDSLVTLAIDGTAVGAVGDRLPADRSLIAWSIRRGRIYRTADVGKEPHANHEAAAEAGIRASIIVPLTAADGTPWALTVNSTEIGAFSAADEALMGLIASSMAGALANAAHRELEVELRRSDQQRHTLMGQLIRAQDEERARIAGDIHDDSVQAMTAAALRIGIARRGITDPVNLERLILAEDTVREAVARLRHLLFELRPRILDTGGIRAAVETYVDQTLLDTGIAHTVSGDVGDTPGAEGRLVVFRIIQEALGNVRMHSRASRVDIDLERENAGVLVTIDDDGIGIADAVTTAVVAGHLGIASMRERAEAADGWLRIARRDEAGTRVQFWIPSYPDVESGGSAI